MIQSWTFAIIRLLNKPYENEVTLTGQNPPLKWCQPLEILTHLIMGMRPPTLTAGNFAALWPTDPKFLALKDLNPFKTVSKVQKTSSILRVGFALSKWPHLHRAYVVGGCLFNFGTVHTTTHCQKRLNSWIKTAVFSISWNHFWRLQTCGGAWRKEGFHV